MLVRHDWRVNESLTGKLLVAAPALTHPTFRRTVILLLDHADHGALGVVVNRPSDVEVDDVLPSWQRHATEPGRVFTGGPVSQDSALCLARLPREAAEPDGLRWIIGSLAVVDLEISPVSLTGQVTGLRVFAGYAGWSPGQLESEIAEGSWFVVDAEPWDAFSNTPEELWQAVLRRQPGDLAYVASYPDDPELN